MCPLIVILNGTKCSEESDELLRTLFENYIHLMHTDPS